MLMGTMTTTPSKHITCVPIELFCVQCHYLGDQLCHNSCS
jgi:hypothetical protein